jgi:hypothetical protein
VISIWSFREDLLMSLMIGAGLVSFARHWSSGALQAQVPPTGPEGGPSSAFYQPPLHWPCVPALFCLLSSSAQQTVRAMRTTRPHCPWSDMTGTSCRGKGSLCQSLSPTHGAHRNSQKTESKCSQDRVALVPGWVSCRP